MTTEDMATQALADEIFAFIRSERPRLISLGIVNPEILDQELKRRCEAFADERRLTLRLKKLDQERKKLEVERKELIEVMFSAEI